jgi:hypothetical protein
MTLIRSSPPDDHRHRQRLNSGWCSGPDLRHDILSLFLLASSAHHGAPIPSETVPSRFAVALVPWPLS